MRRLLTMLVLLSAPVSAQSTTGAFLAVGGDVRALTMGNAATLAPEEAAAIFHNPGSVADSRKVGLYLHDIEWIAGTRINAAALLIPAGPGVFSAGLQALTSADFPIYSETGETLNGNLSCSETSLRAGWAQSFGQFSGGVAAQYFSSSLLFRRSDFLSADFGLVWRESFFRAGLDLRNASIDLNRKGAGEILPMSSGVQAAVAPDLGWFRMVFAVSGRWGMLEDRWNLGGGAEFALWDRVALRAGYQWARGAVSWSFGGGLTIPDARERFLFGFDYSYLPLASFEPVHAFALSLRYDNVKAEKDKKKDRRPPIRVEEEL